VSKRTKFGVVVFTAAVMLAGFLLLRAGCPCCMPVSLPSTSQPDRTVSPTLDGPSHAMVIIHESEAKPLSEEPRREGRTYSVANQANTAPDSSTLVYDNGLTFEANLSKLKTLCSHDPDPKTLEFRSRAFLSQLLDHVPTDGAVILDELYSGEGRPFYRNVLLACFMKTGVNPKDDSLWTVALRQGESETVRATATILLSQTAVSRSRPADILHLIRDGDSDVRVSALQVAPQHMDQTVFDVTRSLAVSNDDIHVRLAAINAIGASDWQGSQSILLGVVTDIQTAASAPFSLESVLKRSAVADLDMSDPTNFRLVQDMATETNEDPGVRRKALVRLGQSKTPGVLTVITSVLDSTPDTEAVVLKGCIEALLAIGTDAAMGAANRRVEHISDQQVKRMLILLIERSKSS